MLQFTAKLQEEFFNLYGSGKELKPSIAGAALGGQDTALADYLLSAQARFALLEFKHDEASIVTEKDKKLRHKLCAELQADRRKSALARDIHYVAWGVRAPTDYGGHFGVQITEDAMVASYPEKVCPLLGCAIGTTRPREYSSNQFIQRFLSSRVAGTNGARFKDYLSLLYKIAGGVEESELKRFQGSVYIFVADPAGILPGQFHKIKFWGLDHLLQLTLGLQLATDKNWLKSSQEGAATSAARRPWPAGHQGDRSGHPRQLRLSGRGCPRSPSRAVSREFANDDAVPSHPGGREGRAPFSCVTARVQFIGARWTWGWTSSVSVRSRTLPFVRRDV